MTELPSLIGSILIILCAVGLMALEAFTPGVGVIGLLGLVLMGIGTYLGWNACGAWAGILLLLAGCALSFFAVRAVLRSMKDGKLSRSGMFLDTESAPTVAQASPVRTLEIGAVGTAQTSLHPLGIAEFKGERIHVTAENGFVEQGASVRITCINGSRITVACVPSESE